jgi:hypothetical protein
MSAVDPDRQALLLERMANAECSADSYLVAASLYQKATFLAPLEMPVK